MKPCNLCGKMFTPHTGTTKGICDECKYKTFDTELSQTTESLSSPSEVQFNINVRIRIVDNLDNQDCVARVYYPNEGNIILIKKGLNAVEFSKAIHHEIGHIFDWYLSNGNQSNDTILRESNAELIGESLRFKTDNNDA